MKSPNTKILPLVAALGLFLILLGLLEYKAIHFTGGIFMYPLDDTFIHMAVAKTLAFHGNWGIAGSEFESASSSVMYTLLLAASFKLFGLHIVIPLIINIVAGCVLLAVVWKRLVREGIGTRWQFATLVAVVIFTPLPILVFAGMEHTLQCIFSFLFLFSAAEWLEGIDLQVKDRLKIPAALVVWGILACAIRYEGAFLVGVVCVLLLFRRRVKSAFFLGFICALPIFIFGVYSIYKGSYFLPNSVLLKSEGAQMSLSGVMSFVFNVVLQKLTISLAGISTVAAQHLLILLPLAFLLFSARLPRNSRYTQVLLILTATTFLQVTLASTGWFYRYEAYLVLSTVVILSILIYKYKSELTPRLRQRPIVMGFLLFVLFLPMVVRVAAAFRKAPTACMNVYGQQYQMGKFLHQYYDDSVVAANDIGAISYLKKEKNLDLWGLANIEVARSRKNSYWTPNFLDSLCRREKAPVAVVFDGWFSDSLLVRWNKVATWTIPDNVICGDSVVSFYAIEPGGVPYLRESLEVYQKQLPPGVTVRYF
ncbi:MAG TPA: hypothetical protein VFE32_01510 [Puia sp.]|jgi:hypothetical protein|nr:hypothetical protein [Puia sp.]